MFKLLLYNNCWILFEQLALLVVEAVSVVQAVGAVLFELFMLLKFL